MKTVRTINGGGGGGWCCCWCRRFFRLTEEADIWCGVVIVVVVAVTSIIIAVTSIIIIIVVVVVERKQVSNRTHTAHAHAHTHTFSTFLVEGARRTVSSVSVGRGSTARVWNPTWARSLVRKRSPIHTLSPYNNDCIQPLSSSTLSSSTAIIIIIMMQDGSNSDNNPPSPFDPTLNDRMNDLAATVTETDRDSFRPTAAEDATAPVNVDHDNNNDHDDNNDGDHNGDGDDDIVVATANGDWFPTPVGNTAVAKGDDDDDPIHENQLHPVENETDFLDRVLLEQEEEMSSSATVATTTAVATSSSSDNDDDHAKLLAQATTATANATNHATTATSTADRCPAVPHNRKQELLLHARRDRLAWIAHAPFPYRTSSSSSSSSSSTVPFATTTNPTTTTTTRTANTSATTMMMPSTAWVNHNPLLATTLASMRVTAHVPSSLAILSHLYGLEHNDNNDHDDDDLEPSSSPDSSNRHYTHKQHQLIAKRIQALLGDSKPPALHDDYNNSNNNNNTNHLKNNSLAWQSAEECFAAQVAQQASLDPDLPFYHLVWHTLQDPACAMLVQGMRTFCHKLTYVQQPTEVLTRLQSYLQSTVQSLPSHHPLWQRLMNAKHDPIHGAATRQPPPRQPPPPPPPEQQQQRVYRALESFLFVQCYAHWESLLWTPAAQAKDKAWTERLNDLQFVTAQHLDIACLADRSSSSCSDGADHKNDINDNYIDDILHEAKEALLSVNLYCSIYDKLQRILAVYKGVNKALSTALNKNRPSSSTTTRLPSADDVLPTIILTVLRAKPEKLLWNLQMVEDYSPPEYLRGEAGYAFTNLYGAVQFLQDLDLNNPKSLSIPPEDFRKGLEACRQQSEERIRNSSMMLSKLSTSRANNDDTDAVKYSNGDGSFLPMWIPPMDIRQARQRGETINAEWVQRWQAEHSPLTKYESGDDLPIAMLKADDHTAATEEPLEGLPTGFTRSYTFLTTRPEDIKLSDLAPLLSEYKMLVHVTERLLSERQAKSTAERRARAERAERDLYDRVRQVDPSLLPKMNGSKR